MASRIVRAATRITSVISDGLDYFIYRSERSTEKFRRQSMSIATWRFYVITTSLHRARGGSLSSHQFAGSEGLEAFRSASSKKRHASSPMLFGNRHRRPQTPPVRRRLDKSAGVWMSTGVFLIAGRARLLPVVAVDSMQPGKEFRGFVLADRNGAIAIADDRLIGFACCQQAGNHRDRLAPGNRRFRLPAPAAALTGAAAPQPCAAG